MSHSLFSLPRDIAELDLDTLDALALDTLDTSLGPDGWRPLAKKSSMRELRLMMVGYSVVVT